MGRERQESLDAPSFWSVQEKREHDRQNPCLKEGLPKERALRYAHAYALIDRAGRSRSASRRAELEKGKKSLGSLGPKRVRQRRRAAERTGAGAKRKTTRT